ncbi:TMEM165/GDT1 family protein [soil metagenome]
MDSVLAGLAVVFLAELGDKTQLVALGLATRYPIRAVITGVAAAYATSQALSVVIGALLGAALPTRAIGIVAGVGFLAFAAWTLLSGGDADDEVDVAGGRSVVLSVFGAMFVAELGDKTMLATATLATKGDPLLTYVGATAGILLAGLLAVVIGRGLGKRLPERATRIMSGVLFAVFGTVLLVTSLFS